MNERNEQIKRWTILLLSPVVWTICFGLLYLLDEAVCGLHVWRWFVWGQVTAVIPIMLLLILLTFGLIIGNAYRSWQLWQKPANALAETTAERDQFIGMSGFMLSSLFAFLTVGLAAAVIVLKPC